MDEREPFETDAQSAKVVKPRNGPLHYPACLTQSATVRLTAPSNLFGQCLLHATDVDVCRGRSLCRPERLEASIVVCQTFR